MEEVKKSSKKKSTRTKKSRVESKKIEEKDTLKEDVKKKSTRARKRKRVEKKEKRNIFNLDNLLKLVFFLLLILVIVLGVMVYKKDNEMSGKVTANIVIPVFEEGSSSSVTINADNLSSDYIIKVTNYRGDSINSSELKYSVNVLNSTSSSIQVLKNKSQDNLMVDNKNTIIEGETLKKNTKENVYYYIRINDYSKVKKDEKIVVRIDS